MIPRFLGPGIFLALTLTACASPQTPPPAPAPAEPDRFLARQVTASDHCGLVAPGLVDIADEATLKRFLALPAQTLTLPAVDHPAFDQEHLLVVALGQQPSAGYGVTLQSAALHDQSLRLDVTVRKPAENQMTAQVVTTPCMVLAIRANDWQRIEVHGDGMPTLTRVR